MSSTGRRAHARRIAAATFVVSFLVIPVALLTSVPLGTIAAILLAVGAACLFASLFVPPAMRSGARDGGRGLIVAAAIVAIIHFSGLLEPMYRREGWLLLDLDVDVAPLRVHPGDILTYTLSTTNTGVRPVLGRQFQVDGAPYTGALVYGRLPELDGVYFSISEPPTVRIFSEAGPSVLPGAVGTVVYANPGLPLLNPMYWDWSTTYTPGWRIVAAVTSDGQTGYALGVGETLCLQYRVRVPLDHPAGKVRHLRGSLSYRDPQWATHYVHDLWFPFEDTVLVEHAPD